jgi:hypothetical protein
MVFQCSFCTTVVNGICFLVPKAKAFINLKSLVVHLLTKTSLALTFECFWKGIRMKNEC